MRSAAGIVAERVVGLSYPVDKGVPLKFTTELVTKFEPSTVNPDSFIPTLTLEGLREERIGDNANNWNSTEVEAPPPGSGLNTKITTVPSLSISLARMPALNCVELTNVVFRGFPPKYTVAPGTKSAPLTCKVNGAAVATVKGGESEEIIGVGLDDVTGPGEIANCAPTLIAVSVHGLQESGVSTPEDAFIEKPRIRARITLDTYRVEVVYANLPVGSKTMEVGLIPSANGDEGNCSSVPVPGAIVKAVILPAY
jgi:hypothetical protein